ncbi:hypothetical protein RUND412_004408 [Rhizina undulata]
MSPSGSGRPFHPFSVGRPMELVLVEFNISVTPATKFPPAESPDMAILDMTSREPDTPAFSQNLVVRVSQRHSDEAAARKVEDQFCTCA